MNILHMNKKIKGLVILFLILSFLAGIYVCLTNGFYPDFMKPKPQPSATSQEGLNETDCPDILIKTGNFYMLYNSKKPKIEGQNPIVFPNLDEYIQYLYSQEQKGVHCPALFLQQEVNAQGKDVYRMRPSPFYVEGGLPPLPTEMPTGIQQVVDSSRENPPYNANNYPGFDPHNQYTGVYTNIDQIHDSTMDKDAVSENAMDPNWGGVEVTIQAVNSGKYDDNLVTKAIYPAVIPF